MLTNRPRLRLCTSILAPLTATLLSFSCATPPQIEPSNSVRVTAKTVQPSLLSASLNYVKGSFALAAVPPLPNVPPFQKKDDLDIFLPNPPVFFEKPVPIPMAFEILTQPLDEQDTRNNPNPTANKQRSSSVGPSVAENTRPLGISESVALAETQSPPTPPVTETQKKAPSEVQPKIGGGEPTVPPESTPVVLKPPLAEVSVASGQSVSIPMPGRGWVYTGEKTGKAGIGYEGRSYAGDNTVFTFRTDGDGLYRLTFQRQATALGSTDFESVHIEVGQVKNTASQATPLATKSELISQGDTFFAAEKYGDALTYYLEGYETGDGELNQKLSTTYEMLGSWQNAAEFLDKNLSSEEPGIRLAASRGLLRIGVQNKRPEILLDLVAAGLPSLQPADNELLLSAGQIAEDSGYPTPAILFYEAALSNGALSIRSDTVYFKLGQLYESTESLRDESKSAEYYAIVVNQYPASMHYEDAKSRLSYLKRHFLEIR